MELVIASSLFSSSDISHVFDMLPLRSFPDIALEETAKP